MTYVSDDNLRSRTSDVRIRTISIDISVEWMRQTSGAVIGIDEETINPAGPSWAPWVVLGVRCQLFLWFSLSSSPLSVIGRSLYCYRLAAFPTLCARCYSLPTGVCLLELLLSCPVLGINGALRSASAGLFSV